MKMINEIKKKIIEVISDPDAITKVELEGPTIAVYTVKPKLFFENENLVAKLAFELKKKVHIRCDKSLLLEEEETRKIIKEIIPEDAGLKKIDFMQPFNEVVIESIKPGLVIGKSGKTTKEIIMKTGWTPKILRAPTQKSEILEGIRYHLIKSSKERKEFLKSTSERIYREINGNNNEWIRLVALGGFKEVGRSSMLVETQNTKIMLDAGINIASQKNAYPYLEVLQYPLDIIDAIVISHAHLDHSGFLPYLFKLGYRGPVYCTEPTRDLMALLQFDYIDVLVKEGKEPIYSERDVKESLKHVIVRDYREVTDIAPDMRLTLHNAAHLLGSASIHLHIGEGAHNLVYSADIKYGFTRLFNNIDINYPRLETLIVESTYGGKKDIQPERQQQEEELLKIVNSTIEKKGNILIPVFAVGRAQEIMLVLENFYRRGELNENTRVYIDGMTSQANAIHTAYPEFLRQNIKKRILQNDSPFMSDLFKIANYDEREEIIKNGSSVILASSGMLTGGASVEYLKLMAEDEKNRLIFVGYQGEGSLGRKIQSGVKQIPMTIKNGKTKALNINLKIETLEGFSGHSDRNQLMAYLRRINPRPKRVIVNHGEKTKAKNFSKAISMKYNVKSMALSDLDAIRLK